MATPDLVIRGGTIADGTGAALFDADVAVHQGKIVDIGRDIPAGVEEFDARGKLVTPGFVDVHTHYDGQVTWESRMTPSSEHGVTTIVTGNCGVGFAPCRVDDHDRLIALMAGVEDIPEVVMTEGLPWTWESFPEYLDAVESRPHDIDIAAMLPHSALRVYVMGERAIAREEATPDDIARMSELATQAIRAGALGFGTSRALQQRSITGEPIPSVRAAEAELLGILQGMGNAGGGVFQLLSDFFEFTDIDGEFEMIRRLVAETRLPTSFTVNQKHNKPDGWRRLLDLTEQASREGLPIKAQVLGRPTGLLLGHDLTANPFSACPSYLAIATLPLAAKVAELRRPELRQRLLDESSNGPIGAWQYRFELGDPPCYEPRREDSIAARASQLGVEPHELAYDILLKHDGTQLLFNAFQNYAASSLDACYDMLRHPDTILGLGDGGAHLGLICDASYPTTMLSYWTRDRTRGPRLTIPEAVRALTSSTADAVGLCDRGRVATGYKADLNVIDYDRLQERMPTVVRDLPAGGRRIVQHADGYVATIVSGHITQRDGQSTSALPGRLVRGAQHRHN